MNQYVIKLIEDLPVRVDDRYNLLLVVDHIRPAAWLTKRSI